MLKYVCPGNNDIFCGGEVEPLNKPVFIPQFGLIEPADGRVCKTCGMVMPKWVLKPKYVWSRQAVWGDFFKTGIVKKPSQSPEAIKVEGVQELLQSSPQVHEEPAEPFLPQIPEKSEIAQKCLDGIFCCVAGEKEPATHNDLVNFFNTPVFSSCQMIVKGRKVVVDYSRGVEAMIKRGRRVVWRGCGEELRAMAKTNPTVALMDWAAKTSK